MNYMNHVQYLNEELIEKALRKMNEELKELDGFNNIEVTLFKLDEPTIIIYASNTVEMATIKIKDKNDKISTQKNTEKLIGVLGNIFQALNK